jgi:dTDP-4-dehydrorhamnose reductase
MIHISTDAVFDGSISHRTESETPAPVSTYGKSKLEGENRILQTLPQALVARVNFFGYSQCKESLFNYFYSSIKTGREIQAYDDIFFTPTYASDTVRLILELEAKSCTGIFHVVGNERISKYEFAKKISNIFKLDSRYINPVNAPLEKMKTLRGYDLSLDNKKLRSLGVLPLSIDDGLLRLKLEMEKINASR